MGFAEILARQKEEIKSKLSGKIIEREAKKSIEKNIDKNIIKVITGVRRSGKSTLALSLLENRKFGYVNFDEKGLVDANLDDLLSAVKEVYGEIKILLLDEIQNVDKWELYVNSLQRRGYNLIITGSNAKLLSKELATHLTGRYVEFEVFPFSFREYLKFKEFNTENIKFLKEKQGTLKSILREYMKKGGFPEYLVEDLSRDYLLTLFRAILYNDVVKRWNVKYVESMENLARYLFSIYGREFSATKLRNMLEFRSTFTVINYIKYLKEAFLIFDLERFSFKTKQFMKAPKKVYSVDLGLSDVVEIKTSKNIGFKMENLVFLGLKRMGLRENRDFFYFKQDNAEVDFVVKEGIRIKELIQVTYASSRDEIERREIKGLLKAYEVFKKDKPKLKIITWDYEGEDEIERKKIEFIPLWKWLISEQNM